jgi:hypothetical protein
MEYLGKKVINPGGSLGLKKYLTGSISSPEAGFWILAAAQDMPHA